MDGTHLSVSEVSYFSPYPTPCFVFESTHERRTSRRSLFVAHVRGRDGHAARHNDRAFAHPGSKSLLQTEKDDA